MSPGTLIIRADANVAMGTGHVMRCLALAQSWQDRGGKCMLAVAEASPLLKKRIASEKIEVVAISASAGTPEDAELIVKLAGEHRARWVVVDGYHFDAEYQRTLKAAGLKLLLVDDTGHAGTYVADLVLDQNAHASEYHYERRAPYTRLLLGAEYAMLRREFKAWRTWEREPAAVVRKVLVTLGGSDPGNVVTRVIRALGVLGENNLEATIVLGGSTPHGGQQEEIDRAGISARLLRNVTNMPELMAEADVAISAAGTTCWEICFMGLPTLLIDVAENQIPVARELDRLGIAIHLGGVKDVSCENVAQKLRTILDARDFRAGVLRKGRALVDGQGSDRVVAVMCEETLRLRPADRKDCRLLWEWVNDEGTRAASFSSKVISWEQHQSWFEDKMKDPGCLILIAENSEAKPVGQIRLDLRSDKEREIDVSVAPDSRGVGLGSQLIDLGVSEAFARTDAQRVHAFIRPENHASIHAFERANFVKLGEDVVRSLPALHYYRVRNPKPI